MRFLKEHQYLLMKRECRVVLGHRASNFVLLTFVLIATFFAIAFSTACKRYLTIKMDDPFTNWVNINVLQNKDPEHNIKIDIDSLKSKLEDAAIRSRYGYDEVHTEFSSSLNFVTNDGKSKKLLSTIFYDSLSNNLLKDVVRPDKENVVYGCSVHADSLANSRWGIIITIDALHYLGYMDNNDLPSYINYYSKSPGANELFIDYVYSDYAQAPLPILAIVKKLPMNKECVATKYLSSIAQMSLEDRPINLNNKNYVDNLYFFVPNNVDVFDDEVICESLPDGLSSYIKDSFDKGDALERVQKKFQPWMKGRIVLVKYKNNPSLRIKSEIEREILKHYSDKGVRRLYDYTEVNTEYKDDDNYLSVEFRNLDSINAFEQYVKDNYNLQIEMSQVNSKKNFAVVSGMANILTVTMVLFSIISIIIFIVNMLQSYFPKVKRNLGTFKAFGVSTKELIGVYVLIIIGIVLAALVIAMAIVWITQLLLPNREGDSGYLVLWNPLTVWTIIIIIASALTSVLIVMRRLLRQTPGNLIYDR